MRTEEVQARTYIRKEYLEAMEKNQFGAIRLADVYRRGYLKIYSNFLELDTARLLKEYQEEYSEEPPPASSLAGNHRAHLEVVADEQMDNAGRGEVATPATFETGAFESHPIVGHQRPAPKKKKSSYTVFVILASISCACLFAYAFKGTIFPGSKDQPVDKKNTQVETSLPAEHLLSVWASERTIVTIVQTGGETVWKDKEIQPGKNNAQQVAVKGGVIIYSPRANSVTVFCHTNGQTFNAPNPNSVGYKLDEKNLSALQPSGANRTRP